MTELSQGWRRLFGWAAGGLGGGAGIALGIEALEAVKTKPELLPQLLQSGVFSFIALIVGMVIFRQEMHDFNELQARNVAANETLAANVGEIVRKDDERTREQDITLNYLARNSETLLAEIREVKKMAQEARP